MIEDWTEYKAIVGFYGDRRAKRSRVPLISHINEGLAILGAINASEVAKRAFCIHPMVQSDEDFATAWTQLEFITTDMRVMTLAMEYRHIANTTLSTRFVSKAADIPLSPIDHVNDMLIADKAQNYKDFLRYHQDHPKRGQMIRYFNLWLTRLGFTTESVMPLVRVAANDTEKRLAEKRAHPKAFKRPISAFSPRQHIVQRGDYMGCVSCGGLYQGPDAHPSCESAFLATLTSLDDWTRTWVYSDATASIFWALTGAWPNPGDWPFQPCSRKPTAPKDADDFARCVALLDVKFEWRSRLGEVAVKVPGFAVFGEQWDSLENTLVEHGRGALQERLDSLR